MSNRVAELALRAARRASEAMARHADLALTEIAGQVRSTAADLIRAAHAGTPDEDAFGEAATYETGRVPVTLIARPAAERTASWGELDAAISRPTGNSSRTMRHGRNPAAHRRDVQSLA